MEIIPKIYLAVGKNLDGIPIEPYLMIADKLPVFQDRQWNHETETVIPEDIFKILPSLMELEENQLFEITIKPIKRITLETLIRQETL